jgi:hypothetical protein
MYKRLKLKIPVPNKTHQNSATNIIFRETIGVYFKKFNFTYYFVWVRNFISHVKGKTRNTDVWEMF